ncbi:MAG: aminotransferase DegT [Legionellales bacterium]|nr:aminotransferase DegT [Legionellales bacterium]OUX65190.1 MAG: hypothetical protein CBE41_01970 [Gammaproteobacteria bacterium TMED281]|tara:strand:- start:213 stop:1358 length:1146 start_codon:yes stop_codon:yes gene_type:complete
MEVPLINLSTDQETRNKLGRAVNKVLDHGKFILGPEVNELERNLESFTGTKHAITCSNGTDALILALLAKGVRPNDFVYVPSFTFSATAEAVAIIGAKPVFIDVDEKTFNIDLLHLKQSHELLTKKNIFPKGVISVDIFGQTCSYNEIQDWITKNEMWLICDGAQSLGATYNDTHVGNFGDITTTSFYPTKPLGCYGDGGCVFTNDDLLFEKIKSLRVHGEGKNKYDNLRVGLNARMDTIQAAILIHKLHDFTLELSKRRELSNFYTKHLNESFVKPFIIPECNPSWAQYTIKISHNSRDKVQNTLAKKGISTCVYYPIPLHMQPAYHEYMNLVGNKLPVSEKIAKCVLSLPMGCNMEQAEYVCQSLNELAEVTSSSFEVA